MATFDSTVRLRQLNQPELSGYIVLVAGGIPSTTGTLTGAFYPYKTNPSGYITTGQTGTFITQSALDSNYYSTLVYVADNYYPLSNPNGYVTSASLSGNAVLTTGDQNISGLKNFYTRPSVNGSGVQLQGEFLIDNAVYTTGNQTINGVKTFIDATVISKIKTNNSITFYPGSSDLSNGITLLSIYADAKALGGWSANERYSIFLGPGRYNLSGSSLVLDTSFIDIIGLDQNADGQYIYSNIS